MAAAPTRASATTRTAPPTWTRTSTLSAAAMPMNNVENQPPAESAPVAPEATSGAALLTDATEPATSGPVYQPAPAPVEVAELPPLPTVQSKDGRVTLTGTSLTVRGQEFALRELERAEITPVKWILWYLLGALGLAGVMIAFLQNWLRTGPAMTGMALTALLLAYGHRGTNRLRLHRLGREALNFALPGEPAPWQSLSAEVNRRIFRVHDHAAREAAALLAAADAAMQQAAREAQAAAESEASANNNTLTNN
ncbi:hypothetical protein ACFST9_16025 [Hymenobacter monticola]|uniref:Uncharacterized protein n=1 Tax=Hymenobacter monticola TaxID=1705399 RepID=A0ABY4B0D1_9BACT|nr:hypothetical protein [Hymenobacter monticola]UOE32584.1 hypothetical protein MTP16_15770 [Hymenobacter monticola]